MSHRPMDFEEMDRLFSYESETGDILNRISRGTKAKAGAIATSRTGKGYLHVQFSKDGRPVSYKAHRVAWLLHYKVDPGNMEVDHINHDKSCNKIENLRLVDHKEQCGNFSKSKRNTSGVTGLSWHKNNSKWVAYIHKDGERCYLGIFEDKWDAICCRKSAENRLGYHKNHGK